MSQRPLLADRLRQSVAEREAASLRRQLRTVTAQQGNWIWVDGQRLLNFASNDYLGLAQAPELAAAMQQAIQKWGSGATAAHLLGGHREPHAALERYAEQWLGYPRALLFSTGYMANLAVLDTCLQSHDLCVQDRLNHACLLDGARLAGARLKRYRHQDLAHAEALLAAEPERAAMLVSDAVFSMDGDQVDVRAITAVAERQQALLFLDDAHGFGVLGPEGKGTVAAAGLGVESVPLQMLTLGKSMGSFGALVVGTDAMIDALVQLARPFLFTTAMPPAVAAASLAAMQTARAQPWRQEALHRRIDVFRTEVADLGYTLMASQTAIQPILIGEAGKTLQCAAALGERGFYAPAIRYPTVPKGEARLRITLSASHTEAELAALIEALRQLRQQPFMNEPSTCG